MSEENRLPTVPTEEWGGLFWAYNLPLQMWGTADDGKADDSWRVLNYMPRKERCQYLESSVTKEELPQFCQNTALILRNLADLFEALGRGEINHIYYPDQLLPEAIKMAEEDKMQEEKDE